MSGVRLPLPLPLVVVAEEEAGAEAGADVEARGFSFSCWRWKDEDVPGYANEPNLCSSRATLSAAIALAVRKRSPAIPGSTIGGPERADSGNLAPPPPQSTYAVRVCDSSFGAES